MTKTYDELISQANTTLADNTNKDISPADQRNMHTDTLDAHDSGTLIVRVEQGTVLPVASKAGRLFYRTDENVLYADTGTTWNKVGGGLLSWGESLAGDLVPNSGGVGVGDTTNPASHMGVGPTGALLGAILEASTAPDGLSGVRIIGTNDLQAANEPVYIHGNTVLIAGGSLYLESATTFAEDHYAILGPTTTLPDGKHFTPLSIGPIVNYGSSEGNTSNANVPLAELSEVSIVQHTTGAAYSIGDSLNCECRIEETNGGNRTAVVDVRMYINAALEFEETVLVHGSQVPYGVTVPLSQAVGIGDTISLRVYWARNTGGGQSPVVAVRGDISPSAIRIASL